MRTLTITFLLISLTQLKAQRSELLIGTWNCYHKELEDGTTSGTDFMGQEFTYSCNDLTLELKDDGTGSESQGGLKFEYVLKDSLLQLGNRVYVIELLNKQELVIRDYDPEEMKLSVYRQKFRREQE
ncbi:hypothetical protein [Marinoscillum sp.]|uniref:hypothetical protein n=1 Tax=Marinoscillum sp. TaxID=2024838 RepID=UPI003BABC8C2